MDPWSLLLGLAVGGAGGMAWQGLRAQRSLPVGWHAVREMPPEQAVHDLPEPVVETTIAVIEWVEDALRHLYDYAYLGEHPLSALSAMRLSDARTRLDQGRHLHEELVKAIDKLRPEGDEPAEAPRSWWPYVLLRESYLVGESRQEVMLRVNLSEGTYNRVRKRAVGSVAKAIRDLEIQARQAAVGGRLEARV